MQTAKHSSSSKVPVTVDNFIRAETDKYFATAVQEAGKIGGFKHYRDFMPISNQTVIRANLDTLYSAAVFDLDAGPVTITLPNAGPRFMSLMVIDEDHYVPQVAYGEGTYTFSKETIGTRYMMAAIRTLADPNDLDDLSEVHSLQDRTKIRQANPGNFEIPPWDMESQKKIRDILLNLGEAMPDSRNMFGARGQVDPVRHLIGTAMAWGGNPEKDAVYINVTPDKNDGKTAYRLRVKDVPVDAFWSISVYNAEGYFQTNLNNAYTINNLTGKKEQDGSVGIQFGNCDGNTPNCLPIIPGWNYMVRLYRPRNEVLDGSWCFPSAQPIG